MHMHGYMLYSVSETLEKDKETESEVTDKDQAQDLTHS